MEKYSRAGQAADENKIWHMHFARLGIMTTDTITKYNIAFYSNNVYANTPQYVYIHYKFRFHAPPPSQELSHSGPFQKLTPGVLVTEKNFQKRLTKAKFHPTEGLRHRAEGCMVLG